MAKWVEDIEHGHPKSSYDKIYVQYEQFTFKFGPDIAFCASLIFGSGSLFRVLPSRTGGDLRTVVLK